MRSSLQVTVALESFWAIGSISWRSDGGFFSRFRLVSLVSLVSVVMEAPRRWINSILLSISLVTGLLRSWVVNKTSIWWIDGRGLVRFRLGSLALLVLEVFSRGSRCGFISYQNRKKSCEGKGFRFGWGVPRIWFLKEVCGFRGFRSAKGWSDCVVLVVLMVDLDSSNLDLVSWFSVSDFAWEERRISFQIRSIQKDLWSFSVKPFQKWGDRVIYLGLEVEELRIGGLQLPGWVLLLLDLKIVGGMNMIGAADQVGFDEIDTPFVRFWFSVYRGFCSKLVAGIGSIQEAFPIWFYGGSEGVVRWLLEHSQSWRWAMGQRFPQGNGLWASNLFGSEMFYHPFLMFDLFRRSSVSYTVFNSHNFLDRERNISVEISDQKGKNCSRLEKLISGGFSLDEYGSNVEGIT